MDENFRYKTISYSFHFVLRQMGNGRLNIDPEFKDRKTWSRNERSRFIESLILGIPTQPIWCEEAPNGDYIVIDGSERLRALMDYSQHKFALSGLKIRKEYNGCYFSDLPYHEMVNLEDRYSFSFIVINYDTSPQLKCEFFRGLFKDSTNFSPQIARNFAYGGSFHLLKNLRNQSEHYLDFVDADRRTASKRNSKIDQTFLFLLMITAVLAGDLEEDTYLDREISVDELLDRTMRSLDENEDLARANAQKVIRYISKINQISEDPLRIILSHNRPFSYQSDESITQVEFYHLFIRASANNEEQSLDHRDLNPRRFIANQPARNLISYIFKARYA